ncbi:chitin synthase-domain-containing protein [Polychytrium aggregatum]|uniref:chitin synthase-domain-containing protein n=1 Tax=Polychytrium aggregatum TaxID=110093 RepID=UPI0022FEF89C|nr:chitin synthase-domain-containing protein [Polychytrium aggregatum]KAI9206621.1 chitin synthase-domain-containing protein [Polychytrium aggregatum]
MDPPNPQHPRPVQAATTFNLPDAGPSSGPGLAVPSGGPGLTAPSRRMTTGIRRTTDGGLVGRQKTLIKPERAVEPRPLLNTQQVKVAPHHKGTSLDSSRSPWKSPWILFSWLVTCCCPGPILRACGKSTPGVQQAWREKVALCVIIFLMSSVVIFFIVFFNSVLCPPALQTPHISVNTAGSVVVGGLLYNTRNSTVDPVARTRWALLDQVYPGYDVSTMFFQRSENLVNCAGLTEKFAQLQYPCEQDNSCLQSATEADMESNGLVLYQRFNCTASTSNSKSTCNDQTSRVIPSPAYEWTDIGNRGFFAIDGIVVNLKPFFDQYPNEAAVDASEAPLYRLLYQQYTLKSDATHIFWKLPQYKAQVKCLISKYAAGVVETQPYSCSIAQYVTLVTSAVILCILATRFSLAVIFAWFRADRVSRKPKDSDLVDRYKGRQMPASYAQRLRDVDIELHPLTDNRASMDGRSGSRNSEYSSIDLGRGFDKRYSAQSGQRLAQQQQQEDPDLYTIVLVTCYSEDEKALRGTLESICSTHYHDQRKLLFVVADGNIKGADSTDTTPNLLLGMMRKSELKTDPVEAKSYIAISSGAKEHNMAEVHAGFFDHKGRGCPMLLIIKCGTPEERSRPRAGNRGKRDSQMILMKFFKHLTLDEPMPPLHHEIYNRIHELMEVTADVFDLVLMVDADTRVHTESLQKMMYAMMNDKMIMGLCGETRIVNKTTSWVTRIQVFEYYISHHFGKAFEAMFGGVTCLPGCFCMYRIKTTNLKGDAVPILCHPDIVEYYSVGSVETLHEKNLLLLGEDRFLTTLMMRRFPKRKMIFVPQAICKTTVPEDFKTLLSQRRRWINSTIHNLMELVKVPLCGTFCFSMQFIIFMDLLSTAILPASLCLTYYLIVMAVLKGNIADPNTITLITVMFLPAVLVILISRKFSYIGWMGIYLLALPVWQLILPLYAFWNFDDFSWGETRKIEGGEGDHAAKEGHFDPRQIEHRHLAEWIAGDRQKIDNYRRSQIMFYQQSGGSSSTLAGGQAPGSTSSGWGPSPQLQGVPVSASNTAPTSKYAPVSDNRLLSMDTITAQRSSHSG